MEYEGAPSFPKRVIFASTWYLGPGLESTLYTVGRGNNSTAVKFSQLGVNVGRNVTSHYIENVHWIRKKK